MRSQGKPFVAGLVALTVLSVTGPAPAIATPTSDAGTPQVIRFHGGGYDSANSVSVDGNGNVYVGGSVDDANGGSTFAVVKLSPQGSVVWRARYNGSAGGVGGAALAVTADSAGNVYAAGYTGDGVIFNTNIDFLVVKFGSDGVQRWAQRFDGPARGYDQATEIVVDASGNAYVTGFAYGLNQGQAFDWSTHKYSPTGAVLWRRTHSGPGTADDRAADMVLAPSGGVVVTGFTKSTGDNVTNDLDTVAYGPSGTVLWQARWTDTAASHEVPVDLDVDASGRLAVTGTTAESASPYAAPSPITLRYNSSGTLVQTIRAGGQSVDLDAAGNMVVAGFFFHDPAGTSSVARFDSAGNRTWTAPLTTAFEDALSMPIVRVDSAGAATVAATVTNVFTHTQDYLTIRFSANGAELWRHRFDGPIKGGDRVAGLVIDAADNAWVTGTSWNNYGSLPGGTADDIVTLRFPAGSRPALLAPTDLVARGISRSEIRLQWQDHAGTETGFRIHRCLGVGCTNFTQVAVVDHDVTEYVDGGLARNTQYSYRVRAFNATELSAYSNTATGKTLKR